MQSCWMENPLMRPTFEDIRNRIKYLLRTFKVCVADILTGTVSASSNGVFFFRAFFCFCTFVLFTNFTEKRSR